VTADIKTSVLGQEEIAPGVFYIRLARTGDFIPGQLLALSKEAGGDLRYYSLASGLDDDFWGILYDRVAEGRLTPVLSEMTPGDVLYVSEPFGDFLPRKSSMVWIGTGTGIAPYYSMLRSGLAGDSVIMIHGARKREDFYFYDSFRNSLGDRYIPCSSQSEEPGFYPGRLSRYLNEEFSFPDSTFYLCGSSSMVVDIRDILVARGVDYNRIISEIYF